MSFPALALAAAAAAEVTRYTGVKPSFIRSLDIDIHLQRVYSVSADVVAFGYLETQADGWPLGIHDPARPRDEIDQSLDEAAEAAS